MRMEGALRSPGIGEGAKRGDLILSAPWVDVLHSYWWRRSFRSATDTTTTSTSTDTRPPIADTYWPCAPRHKGRVPRGASLL